MFSGPQTISAKHVVLAVQLKTCFHRLASQLEMVLNRGPINAETALMFRSSFGFNRGNTDPKARPVIENTSMVRLLVRPVEITAVTFGWPAVTLQMGI